MFINIKNRVTRMVQISISRSITLIKATVKLNWNWIKILKFFFRMDINSRAYCKSHNVSRMRNFNSEKICNPAAGTVAFKWLLCRSQNPMPIKNAFKIKGSWTFWLRWNFLLSCQRKRSLLFSPKCDQVFYKMLIVNFPETGHRFRKLAHLLEFLILSYHKA